MKKEDIIKLIDSRDSLTSTISSLKTKYNEIYEVLEAWRKSPTKYKDNSHFSFTDYIKEMTIRNLIFTFTDQYDHYGNSTHKKYEFVNDSITKAISNNPILLKLLIDSYQIELRVKIRQLELRLEKVIEEIANGAQI